MKFEFRIDAARLQSCMLLNKPRKNTNKFKKAMNEPFFPLRKFVLHRSFKAMIYIKSLWFYEKKSTNKLKCKDEDTGK